MQRMFAMCTHFNQPVDFDTSQVTNMQGMFQKCTNFNQPVDFDTSQVTNMEDMFTGCTNFDVKNRRFRLKTGGKVNTINKRKTAKNKKQNWGRMIIKM
jgi:surface protein